MDNMLRDQKLCKSHFFKLTRHLEHVFYGPMKLLFQLLILLTLSPLYAAPYEGRITLIDGKTHFIDAKNGKNYVLSGATPLMASYINKLKNGDFLSLDGAKVDFQPKLEVYAINYVGLALLLGTWYSGDSQCYMFETFTSFSISHRQGKTCLPPSEPDYTYLVNPASGNWVVMISGHYGGNYLGDVKILNAQQIEIQLYNSATGDILRTIQLRK